MAKRSFPETLIPPGVNDERSRAILNAFSVMAETFDFSRLLMRTGSEIPDEALPLAIHDFSLEEFIAEDGLPAAMVRRLIDRAWELHELQGLDEGVELGQSLLGIDADIRHWWQQEPRGHHDTHEITLDIGNPNENSTEPLSLEVQKTALQMIEVTKRYSQETALTWRSRKDWLVHINAWNREHRTNRLLPTLTTDVKNRQRLYLSGTSQTGEAVRIRPKPVDQVEIPSPLALIGTECTGARIAVRPQPSPPLVGHAAVHAACQVRPFHHTISVFPRPS